MKQKKMAQNEKLNMVPLKDLNLTDRFLFDQVMDDPLAHQAALCIIFGKDVPLLTKNDTEKELRVSPHIRAVRMDVYSMDENKAIYNTEMQGAQKTDLMKRSRYYQALIDTGLLEPGIPNYNLLNESYIIIIMPFDLFGYKKYRYTFRPRCEEVPELILEDGATRIFLNIMGENPEEVSEELVDFLHYLDETTDDIAVRTKSPRIRYIHERVCKVKTSEEVGVKYMQAWEEKYFAMQEAREMGLAEGRAEGRVEGVRFQLKEQIQKKLSKGKSIEVIADELEESVELVWQLVEELSAKVSKEK